MADKKKEAATEVKKYSLEEVSNHSDRKSVWVVIHDDVYDVTPFLDEHPGGEEVLLEHAGQIATEAFEDVGHSSDARELMKNFRIGEVVEEDKKHTRSKGPMQWSSSDSPQASWLSWLLPIGIGLLAAVLYRTYMQ